jgi:hypothetical protein
MCRANIDMTIEQILVANADFLFFIILVYSHSKLTLIWASNKKLLPTLVGFNTMRVWLSCIVLAQKFNLTHYYGR